MNVLAKQKVKVCLLILTLFPVLAEAHGFGARIDLPIPLDLYLIGAGTILGISFLLISFLGGGSKKPGQYPRYNLLDINFVKNVLSSSILLETFKALFVLLFLAVVIGGFVGEQNAAFNIAPTFVWIIFGVGLTYFSALFGNIWSLINPLKTIYGYVSFLWKRMPTSQPWPQAWGVWPAAIGFFVYRWLENVYPNSSEPATLASLLLLYGMVTMLGMFYFGKDNWLRYGDPFSVFFRYLSRFSITQWRESNGKPELNLRPPILGVFEPDENIDSSVVAFVLFMLSSVAFDGLEATPLWLLNADILSKIGLPEMVIGTIGLLATFLLFAMVYLVFSYLVRLISFTAASTATLAKTFVFSLLPIAIVYEMAHYMTLLVIEGQRALALISDPFGLGWDIFSTADRAINYQLINLKAFWNWQVGLIVAGHVIAVYVSHVIAMHFFGDRRSATQSQYPMLVLMVGYTMLGLWILAQPIVAGAA